MPHLLCFGDSNTYGYDPRGFGGGRYSAADRWVDLLAQATGWTLDNHGVNGREIPHTKGTLRDAAALFAGDYDLAVVMLGTNDLLFNLRFTAEQTADRMVTFLRAMPPLPVVLLAPPPFGPVPWEGCQYAEQQSRLLGQCYQAAAAELNVPFADTGTWGIEVGFDGAHFSEAGHRTFAQALRRVLTPLVEKQD